ncbi:MAG: glycoside hydrolase family 117 protein [Planctomycetota bacterium]|jgi:hypothetical protein
MNRHPAIIAAIFLILGGCSSFSVRKNAGDRSISSDEFKSEFHYSPLAGLEYDKKVMRRDSSDVIKVGSLYYVWYTKGNQYHGYDATIWYATSEDGRLWTERAEALQRGGPASWDEQSVFTPNILVAEGRYYLFFTGVSKPFSDRSKTAIGVAEADLPDGPWKKFDGNPILITGESGKWIGSSGTKAEPKGAWDSHRVDDACLLVRDGKCWLYYKGRQMGLSPRETKMGLAVADRPTGLYIKHENNPLIKSGHEVLVWPHGGGVAALIRTGPESNTIQYAPDGLNFSIMGQLKNQPWAPGAYRPDAFLDSRHGSGVIWGISLKVHNKWPYLVRYDCDLGLSK